MALIGNLIVHVGGNADQLNKTLEAARRSLGKFAGEVNSIGGAEGGGLFGSLFDRIVPTIDVLHFAETAISGVKDAISALVGQQLVAVEAMTLLSERTGATTENLVALHYQASLMQITQAEVNTALDQFVKRIGETSRGSGSAGKALKMLGLSAKELSGMDTVDAVAMVADRIKGIEDASLRASLAVDLFGRQGQQVMSLLLSGSTGFEAARKEAEALGLTFSNIDGKQVEFANDAVHRLQLGLTGVATQLAVEFAPQIEMIANKFREWGMAATQSSADAIGGISILTSALIEVEVFLSDFLEAFKILGKGIVVIFQAVAAGIAGVFNTVINGAIRGINSLTGSDIGEIQVLKEFEAQAQKSLGSTVDSLWEDLMGPSAGEDFRRQIEEAMASARARAEAAADDRVKELGGGEPSVGGNFKLPGLAVQGSKEAFSSIGRAFGEGAKNPMERMQTLQEKAIAEHKRTNRLLERVARDRADVLEAVEI